MALNIYRLFDVYARGAGLLRKLPPDYPGAAKPQPHDCTNERWAPKFRRLHNFCVHQALGKSAHASKILDVSRTEPPPPPKVDLERGDRVRIKDGPFENFEGTVEEIIEGRGLVKVMLIIFNRPTPVDLEYWQLDRL